MCVHNPYAVQTGPSSLVVQALRYPLLALDICTCIFIVSCWVYNACSLVFKSVILLSFQMAELQIHVVAEEMLFLEEDTSLSESTGGQPSTPPVQWKISKRPSYAEHRFSFHRSPLLAVAPPGHLPSFDFGPACCGPLIAAPSEPPAAAPSEPSAAAPS